MNVERWDFARELREERDVGIRAEGREPRRYNKEIGSSLSAVSGHSFGI